jgi:hypothetical protein
MTVQDRASRAMLDLHEITIEWQKKEWLGEALLHELHCHIGAIQRIFDLAIPTPPSAPASDAGKTTQGNLVLPSMARSN